MTTVEEIKKLSDVEMLEFVALEYIAQGDSIRKHKGDPEPQFAIARRLDDLAKALWTFSNGK